MLTMIRRIILTLTEMLFEVLMLGIVFVFLFGQAQE